MKKLLCLWLGIIGLIIVAIPAGYASNIEKIIVFGDSLSDNGNLYGLTQKANSFTSYVPVLPKDPPYFKGRFSNGPVWIEHVAQILNVPLVDYAYGGAWAEGVVDSGQIIPFSLGTQIDFFLTASVTDTHTSNYLYVIWAGGNDYLHGRPDVDYATTNTVNTIRDQIEWLTYYGAKKFLIINLPNFGTTPGIIQQGPDYVFAAAKFSEQHNIKLAAMIEEEKRKYPTVQFITVDITQFYTDVIAHPDNYRIKNLNTACYTGGYSRRALTANISTPELEAAKAAKINIENNESLMTAYLTAKLAEKGQLACSNPDEYFYWDNVHPSRAIHQAFSNVVVSALRQNGVG